MLLACPIPDPFDLLSTNIITFTVRVSLTNLLIFAGCNPKFGSQGFLVIGRCQCLSVCEKMCEDLARNIVGQSVHMCQDDGPLCHQSAPDEILVLTQ